MIDFGLSKNYRRSELVTLVGTPYYVAPELFKEEYTYKCDYWSLGVMLYVMLSGKPPFYASNDRQIFKKILKCRYGFQNPIWETISGVAKSLIERMIVTDPEKRLSPQDALHDDWFSKINLHMNQLGKNELSHELVERLTKFQTINGFQKEVIKLMVNICDSDEISKL